MGIELKTYSDILILSELDNNGDTHLLLGNDFNLSIGIDTSYNDIFNKMKERYKGYKDLTIEGDNYDIEKIIGKLKNQLKDSDCKPFLEKFINDRIKLEFMNSAFTIVKDSLKNIHQEKNEGIKVLFKKFTNYFSLDYDPFLGNYIYCDTNLIKKGGVLYVFYFGGFVSVNLFIDSSDSTSNVLFSSLKTELIYSSAFFSAFQEFNIFSAIFFLSSCL